MGIRRLSLACPERHSYDKPVLGFDEHISAGPDSLIASDPMLPRAAFDVPTPYRQPVDYLGAHSSPLAAVSSEAACHPSYPVGVGSAGTG